MNFLRQEQEEMNGSRKSPITESDDNQQQRPISIEISSAYYCIYIVIFLLSIIFTFLLSIIFTLKDQLKPTFGLYTVTELNWSILIK